MVPVMIETLVVGIPPSPSVVVLRPLDTDATGARVLPIWIGPTEAAAIGLALEGSPRMRPMTHDFMTKLIEGLQAEVARVVIDRVDGSTSFATVSLTQGERPVHLDARPSDSIALAIRAKAPLFVEEKVLDAASFPYVFAPHANREAAMSEFRSFLETVTPEDFELQ